MKYSHTLTDFYDEYDGRLNKQTFKEVIKVYCEVVITYLLKGHKVILPQGMGYLKIGKGKFKAKAPNWLKTQEIYGKHNEENPDDKKLVYHDNSHTDGYRLKVLWKRNTLPIKNKSLFVFKFTRYNSRKISKLIQEDTSLIYNLNDL